MNTGGIMMLLTTSLSRTVSGTRSGCSLRSETKQDVLLPDHISVITNWLKSRETDVSCDALLGFIISFLLLLLCVCPLGLHHLHKHTVLTRAEGRVQIYNQTQTSPKNHQIKWSTSESDLTFCVSLVWSSREESADPAAVVMTTEEMRINNRHTHLLCQKLAPISHS